VDALTGAMEFISLFLEIVGVATILAGFLYAIVLAVRMWSVGRREDAYGALRRVFGKSILLGLEILVAADLVRTIAVEPTLDNLYVLGLLVLIRTLLSWSLDVELEGAWPWNKRAIEHQEALAKAKSCD